MKKSKPVFSNLTDVILHCQQELNSHFDAMIETVSELASAMGSVNNVPEVDSFDPIQMERVRKGVRRRLKKKHRRPDRRADGQSTTMMAAAAIRKSGKRSLHLDDMLAGMYKLGWKTSSKKPKSSVAVQIRQEMKSKSKADRRVVPSGKPGFYKAARGAAEAK
jgi:hypothetical protein